MKQEFGIIFIIIAVCLMICVWLAGKSHKKIAKSVQRLLGAAAIGTLANHVMVVTENKNTALVGYTAFFISIIWVIYYLLYFLVEYCKYEVAEVIRNYRLVKLVVILDSVSILANFVLHHAFDCKEEIIWTGELIYRIEANVGYNMHLLVSYGLVACSFLCLIYKIYKTPSLYRGKYLLLLLLLSVIVALDMIYVFWEMPIDISIIFFAAAGVCIYYGALIHKPVEIIHRGLARVVQGMSDAVFLFDIAGRCIVINDKAKEMYDVSKDDTEQIEKDFARWYQHHKDSDKVEYDFQVTQFQEERTRYLKLHAKKLLDNKKRFLGVFFIIQDRTEEVEKVQSELYLAHYDPLTNLYNREYFYKCVSLCLRENPDEEYIMICSDVRNFKLVNDVFGSKTGDEILVKMSNAIRKLTKPGEIFGRLGDDKFGLLMKKKDYKEEIFVNEPAKVVRMEDDNSFPLNVYIGVYEILDKSIPVPVMCDRAFMAISTIKGNYQVKVAYYDDALRENVLREQKMSGEMEQALENGQFHLYIQPQVTAEGNVIGGEALIRWEHPEEGMISPGEFVPVFEKNGQIAKLDYYIWEKACQYLKKWKEQGKEEYYISVNISMKDCYFMDISKVFKALVKKYDISPKNLKLEITETAVIEDLKKQQGMIQVLRDAGFIVEMDDFGSGYSSLNMLKDIYVDILKVDMAFLEKGGDQKRGRAILRTIAQLSRRLGMPVIIEGVEDAEQVEFLKMIGCDMFQGYYFSKPIPVVEFEERYMQ